MAAREEFKIERAVRSDALLRLALQATSNGGKTWTGLEIAFGIVEELLERKLITGSLEGKVGVVDTERKSSRLYAHLGPFDTINLTPPYTIERYRGAIEALERAGVAVILVDQISHAWAGPGGLRALLATFDRKDQFSAYDSTINPLQDEFIDMMLRSRCHLIATMRCKTEWVLEDRANRAGHMVKTPRRIGMAPIQRPGIEYEFTTLIDLDTDTHVARVLKNRCPHFADWTPRKLTREDGRALAAWLLEAKPEEGAVRPAGTPLERVTAIAEAATRACQDAATVPDLVRVFTEGTKAIQGFHGVLAREELSPLINQVTEAKDERKAALGGDRAGKKIDTSGPVEPAGPTNVGAQVMEDKITEEQEEQLRRAIRMSGTTVGACVLQFKVARLAEIRRSAFGQCLGWIQAQANQGGQKNHFADMEDDIPF